MKKLLTALVVLLALAGAGDLRAQGAVQQVFFPIVTNYDYDSASFTYLVLGEQVSSSQQGLGNVKTTGSSATTAAAGTATPFADFVKGNEITVQPGGGAITLTRGVFAVASSTSITVDTAWDLSGNSTTGYPFTYRRIKGGTGDGDGWFPVNGLRNRVVHFGIEQLSVGAGSVQVEIDCKSPGPVSKPDPIYPVVGGATQCESGAFTVAGATARCSVAIPDAFGFSVCRFGVKLTDDGGDTGANAEIVWATFEGSK